MLQAVANCFGRIFLLQIAAKFRNLGDRLLYVRLRSVAECYRYVRRLPKADEHGVVAIETGSRQVYDWLKEVTANTI